MNVDLIWKIVAGFCKAIRSLTRAKPKKGTFLIVEDNPLDASILEHKIRKRGWDSEIAKSGEEATALVRHTFYPLAFVDMRLPGMPGEALLQHLSQVSPATSVIVCCGEPRDLERIPEGQFVCVIRKPPTLEAIEDLLTKLKI